MKKQLVILAQLIYCNATSHVVDCRHGIDDDAFPHLPQLLPSARRKQRRVRHIPQNDSLSCNNPRKTLLSRLTRLQPQAVSRVQRDADPKRAEALRAYQTTVKNLPVAREKFKAYYATTGREWPKVGHTKGERAHLAAKYGLKVGATCFLPLLSTF